MATSQNGWPVLDSGSGLLHTWTIPAKTGTRQIRLRGGSAGFLLCHFMLWFAEEVEPLTGGVLDDWGYAYRPIRGQLTGFSNHASGTAVDANATKHVLGARNTFTAEQAKKIRSRLKWTGGAIRWGGDYVTRADEMHFEINRPLADCERIAKWLLRTPRGKRLLAANPSQRKVIYL
jgi:hypothetical protein